MLKAGDILLVSRMDGESCTLVVQVIDSIGSSVIRAKILYSAEHPHMLGKLARLWADQTNVTDPDDIYVKTTWGRLPAKILRDIAERALLHGTR